jgi:hypothetical protein
VLLFRKLLAIFLLWLLKVRMAPNLEQMAKTGAEDLLHRREDIVGDVFLGFVNVVDLEI